jgi:hypothetical protein
MLETNRAEKAEFLNQLLITGPEQKLDRFAVLAGWRPPCYSKPEEIMCDDGYHKDLHFLSLNAMLTFDGKQMLVCEWLTERIGDEDRVKRLAKLWPMLKFTVRVWRGPEHSTFYENGAPERFPAN